MRAGSRPRRRRGDAAAAAHPRDAQAHGPRHEHALPGADAAPAQGGGDRGRHPAGRLPARGDHLVLRRRLGAGAAAALRDRGGAAGHRRGAQERGPVHRRAVLRAQRRRADLARPAGHARLPPPQGRDRDAAPDPGRGPRAPSAASSTTRAAGSSGSSRSRPAARRRPTRSTPAPTCSSARCST